MRFGVVIEGKNKGAVAAVLKSIASLVEEGAQGGSGTVGGVSIELKTRWGFEDEKVEEKQL